MYAMIDDGELDWVVTINVDDPKADKVNNVEDIEGSSQELEKILIWFRDYKMPDGKLREQVRLQQQVPGRGLRPQGHRRDPRVLQQPQERCQGEHRGAQLGLNGGTLARRQH